MYIFKKNVYILKIFIYIYINYMNKYIHGSKCKYFQNIYCMCIYLYIIYTQYTHTLCKQTFVLNAINPLTAI